MGWGIRRRLSAAPFAGCIFVRMCLPSAAWCGTVRGIFRIICRPPPFRERPRPVSSGYGVDAIDLYQIHWAAWKGGPEAASPGSIDEAVAMLAKLKFEGKIRHIGVSNFDARQLARARRIAPIASVQPPYSLVATGIEASVLPYAREHGIGVCLLPHGIRTADRHHDPGADRGASRGRLAKT
jgi:hypothetical protein